MFYRIRRKIILFLYLVVIFWWFILTGYFFSVTHNSKPLKKAFKASISSLPYLYNFKTIEGYDVIYGGIPANTKKSFNVLQTGYFNESLNFLNIDTRNRLNKKEMMDLLTILYLHKVFIIDLDELKNLKLESTQQKQSNFRYKVNHLRKIKDYVNDVDDFFYISFGIIDLQKFIFLDKVKCFLYIFNNF